MNTCAACGWFVPIDFDDHDGHCKCLNIEVEDILPACESFTEVFLDTWQQDKEEGDV